MSAKLVDGDYHDAVCIGVQGDRCLVELPRESASGRWQIWVPTEQIVSA